MSLRCPPYRSLVPAWSVTFDTVKSLMLWAAVTVMGMYYGQYYTKSWITLPDSELRTALRMGPSGLFVEQTNSMWALSPSKALASLTHR